MDLNSVSNPMHIDSRDAAMIRRLAEDAAPSGEARLGLERRGRVRLERLLRRAEALSGVENESLDRLKREARLILSCAGEASRNGGKLPSRRGKPRVEALMTRLIDGGDRPVSRERLLGALSALDAARPMTMAELWAAPMAMKVALSRALVTTAASIVRRGDLCVQAARWVARGGRGRADDAPAFIEHALKRAAEDGAPEARSRLEARLARRGQSAEAAVREAQAAQARDALRLENLLVARRMLEGLNWQRCFEALSWVEQALRRDPAGTYPRMDDDSRAALRAQLACIARRANLPEASVARHALDAARDGEGIRNGVCWWLYDDAGRRALLRRMDREKVRLRAMTPDPSGLGVMAVHIGLAALLTAGLAALAGRVWLAAPCALLAWTAAGMLIGRTYPKLFAPARLLKLEMETVPEDARTLVVMPVLLSAPARAEDVLDQLEALGCLESDENIEYLLLGDFADAPRRDMPGDEEILRRARTRIAAMNARAGREKYAFLHRSRAPLAVDGLWMGRDRKRGALTELNRLLLGEAGAEAAFGAEGAACGRLRGRFRYVLTLDADTRLLPGEARRLIGAMAHPLNRPGDGRGYAVLQPRMEPLPEACVNGFVRLFAGPGGLNAYPVSVSNLWQDLTGRGIYAGKGIYDVAAFHGRLDGALPEGRVLSHDLIEGALAGAGFAGDIAFYDGYPTSLTAFLRRRHRWTRGDWQLLPLMGHPRLSGADRFRMADNLVRSLNAPALLALFIGAVWGGNGGTLLAALIVNNLEPLLNPDARGRLWRRAAAQMAILPALAWNSLDAVGRTLWRVYGSGRRLMQWVTAADAEGRDAGREAAWPGRIAAVAVLPGLLVPGWALGALGLAALFAIGPAWIHDMEQEPVGRAGRLPEAERRYLEEIAADTWRFFEATVPPEGAGLPPDNVQLDPPTGAVRRTSPTNIALYLLSCLSARRLGFIGVEEMRRRMAGTLDTLERLEKWRGHLYNWVDAETFAPLKPRYVSSVDSGNLAAALLLCASAGEAGETLAPRMRALAEGMDFSALYDDEKELFAIGLDGETGRLGQSHYDLLASESRILSYVAMMLGQIPVRHWNRLGRPCARVAGGACLLSWSGTMFEYLMPALFMDAPEETLLGESQRTAVAAQAALGKRLGRPWGVSESGHSALDGALNYQYRAFGLPELSMSGESEAGVVAPYAAALAAMIAPRAAAENLRRMEDMGWRGAWGFYEAADYRRSGDDGAPTLVKSHMAHHQGMALCALCNVLTENSLRRDFMAMPRARALSLLLQERRCDAPRPRRAERSRRAEESGPRFARVAGSGAVPQTQLLYGAGATALYTSDGAAHYRRFGVDATRFHGDLQRRADRACVHLRDEDSGAFVVLGGAGSRTGFEPGVVQSVTRLGRVEAALAMGVSPEDGTLLRVIELRNRGERPARLSLTDVVPVALARPEDYEAHPAFQNMFVESARLGDGTLVFRRRPGSRGADGPKLGHLLAAEGDVEYETDYEKLVGREGDSGAPGGVAARLTGSLGATLNPVSALRATVELAPGARAKICTALALLEAGASAGAWAGRWHQPGQPERALRLAGGQARAMASFLGLNAGHCHALQRFAALLVDGRLAAQTRALRPGEGAVNRRALWPLGLSGEGPMLAMSVKTEAEAGAARELIRAHGFYRAAGLKADLVLLDDGEGGYARPVRDALEALIAAGSLNNHRGQAGGVWLLEGGQLSAEQRRAIERGASAVFDGSRDFYAQLHERLSRLEGPLAQPVRPLLTGASTLKTGERRFDNGIGGFLPEGGYEIDARSGALPPAPWCDILANDAAGLLLTERGGGFFWANNSRMGRLTPWTGDALDEGWGIALWLVNGRGETLSLLPGKRPAMPFRARYGAGSVSYAFETRRISGEARFSMNGCLPEVNIDIAIENRALRDGEYRLLAGVDWLMGEHAWDAALLNTWHEGGACFATGAMAGVGWLAAPEAAAQGGPGRLALLAGDAAAPARGEGWSLWVPLAPRRGEGVRTRLVLGWSGDLGAARERVDALRSEGEIEPEMPPRITIDTPDEALNHLFNHFLMHQVRAARMMGRTGFYQPGGAFGFRDQLQDVLALMREEPGRAREHLLLCAARQFQSGDALHWWHMPASGVRTRISDDMLFLPYVTAAYVRESGDGAVLNEMIPFLRDVEIPEDQPDIYMEMRPGEASGTLHDHCMRAFRRAARTGGHGLLRMGAGDWNDGMDRVGAAGRGESVWLTQFAIACADAYREIAPVEADRAWLEALARRLRIAVEVHGWDGGWYLRAYDDDGAPLGGAGNAECRIDAISQAWAVLAGLDAARCRVAMDAAWDRLVDEAHGLIRLLTPPFDGRGANPGYIRGYPPGVRENGGQYTHGALWLLLALIRMGDADRAHRAIKMLLPAYHADAPEKVKAYRVEPYVMAADVYDRPGMEGRGGWTWYTGAAGWMHSCTLELLGYERRGNRVKLGALLGEWPRASLTVPFGRSEYRLVCDHRADGVTLDGAHVEGGFIEMIDDGGTHEAVFPPRRA